MSHTAIQPGGLYVLMSCNFLFPHLVLYLFWFVTLKLGRFDFATFTSFNNGLGFSERFRRLSFLKDE